MRPPPSGHPRAHGRPRGLARATSLALVLAAASATGACSGCSGLYLRGHLPPARPIGVIQFVPVGDTVVLPDRRRFGTAPVVGARILAAFHSRALREQYLAPTRSVGQLDGHGLTVADILVATDPISDSIVAGWTVAGPESVIRAYVAALKRVSDDRSVLYDLNAVFVPVKYSAGSDR